VFIGCFLYDDDIILLTLSVARLQEMLNVCYEISFSVSLQFAVRKCYCMPIIIGKMHKSVIPPRNVCWNSVIKRTFGYQRSECVKSVIDGLGRLSVKYQIALYKVKFYKCLFFTTGILLDVFWILLLSDGDNDHNEGGFLAHCTLLLTMHSHSFITMSIVNYFVRGMCAIRLFYCSVCLYIFVCFLCSFLANKRVHLLQCRGKSMCHAHCPARHTRCLLLSTRCSMPVVNTTEFSFLDVCRIWCPSLCKSS